MNEKVMVGNVEIIALLDMVPRPGRRQIFSQMLLPTVGEYTRKTQSLMVG